MLLGRHLIELINIIITTMQANKLNVHNIIILLTIFAHMTSHKNHMSRRKHTKHSIQLQEPFNIQINLVM